MADYKIEVLKQLEEGKISAEDALAMLGQQKPPSAEGQPQQPQNAAHTPGQPQDVSYTSGHTRGVPPVPPQTGHSHGFESRGRGEHVPPPATSNWLDDLFGWVGDVVHDVVEGVQDMGIHDNIADFVGGVYGHHKRSETFASQTLRQDISGLTLVGKNARVTVRGYDGDVIRVECNFDSRRPDAEVYFHEENGVFQLVYDEKMMRTMSINCEVPRIMISEVLVASKNAKVLVEGLTAGRVRIASKNDGIKVESLSCTELIVQNRNDAIRVFGVGAENIHLETTNAKIVAESIRANIANLKTSNARIQTENADVINMQLHTTNSGLKLNKTLQGIDGHDGERVLEAHTTNGGIVFVAPLEMALNIQAYTTHGKVACGREDLSYSDFSKGYINGESHSYEHKGNRMRVKLSTTNSSIKIFEG